MMDVNRNCYQQDVLVIANGSYKSIPVSLPYVSYYYLSFLAYYYLSFFYKLVPTQQKLNTIEKK